MRKPDGGQAFPVPETEFSGFHEGMSLRDYFAANAMQGILSNPAQLDKVSESAAVWVAEDAYLVADAMLTARNE